MPEFRYEAVNADGETLAGRIAAQSEREAQRQIRDRGLIPVTLAPYRPSAGRLHFRRAPRQRDLILLIRQLATLLGAGVGIAEALQSLSEGQENPVLGEALAGLERALRQGSAFTPALRSHLPDLPVYVHQLAEAGEATGGLDKALSDAAGQMEYEDRMRQDMRNALTYPTVLVAFGISAVLFIFVVVVPRFATMLKNPKADLPWISDVVITTGMFIYRNTLTVAMVVALLVVVALFAARQPRVRAAMMGLLLRLPLVGSWLRGAETGRWATMLGTLLANRIPLMQALDLARRSLRFPRLRQQMAQVERAVRTGNALSKALTDYTDLERSSISLVRVGEQSGHLPEMLRSLAELYARASQNRMKRFLALVEPAAILLIAGAVGSIVIGIILAITSIYEVAL
jgi:general secretion pathway protein F